MDRGAGRTTPVRALDREVHAVGHRQAVDALEQEREVERALELDDHRRLVAARRDDVTAAHLALDGVALALEEGLDGGVEIRLAAGVQLDNP